MTRYMLIYIIYMWFGGWVPDFVNRQVWACVGIKTRYLEKGVMSSDFIDS